MYAKIVAVVLSMFLSALAYGQTSYSYVDPCTGTTRTINFPSTGIVVTYYGEIRVFQPSDFYNGTFENWAQGVYGSFGGSNPCASVVGLPTGINIAQGTTINLLGIVNSLDAISGIASSTTGAANVSVPDQNNTSSNGSAQPNSNVSGNTGNSGSSQAGGGTSNSQSSSTQGGNNQGSAGNSQSQNGQGSGAGGRQSGSGTGQGEQANQESSGGKTDVAGSSVKSAETSSSDESGGGSGPSARGGLRPNIVANSDLAAFNYKNSEVNYGGKFTGGYTAVRWDGARSYGIVADYTTALRGPNISGFYAFLRDKRIDIVSGGVTVGFDTKFTIYGTLSAGQMWNLTKDKKAKALYMATVSAGKVFNENFLGTAVIAGGMYDWKITKGLDMKIMGLYVYAPYVVYYTDILLKSPHVILPIVGTNIGITKKFKININTGGAFAVNEKALNYTVMIGTRLLL